MTFDLLRVFLRFVVFCLQLFLLKFGFNKVLSHWFGFISFMSSQTVCFCPSEDFSPGPQVRTRKLFK